MEISNNKIICAAVSLLAQVASRADLPFVGSKVKGFDYMSEENVDILALQAGKEGFGSYLRIGRGRVIKKGWLGTCSEENVQIF
jgi:hypothetical protein